MVTVNTLRALLRFNGTPPYPDDSLAKRDQIVCLYGALFALTFRLNTVSWDETETLPFPLLQPRMVSAAHFFPIYDSRLNKGRQIYNERKHGITGKKHERAFV